MSAAALVSLGLFVGLVVGLALARFEYFMEEDNDGY